MASLSRILNSTATRRFRPLRAATGAHELRETFVLAIDSLRRNPLRSALTILGIVIGIATLIAVSTVITGLNENVLGGIRELGSDTIICYRFPWASLSRPPSEWLQRKELLPEWAEEMALLPHVSAASPSLRIFLPQFGAGSASIRRGEHRARNVILQGNAPDISKIFEITLERGRWLNDTDLEHRSPVVVLGYDTVRILFPDPADDPIGQEVTMEGQLFTVIGTAQKRKQGLAGGSNPEDNIAMMPVTTLRKLYPNQKDYVIFAKASDPDHVTESVEEIRELLRRKRRLPSDKPDDFALFTSDYFLELWQKISGLIFIMTFAVALVALLVGGIGVMNIMLVSVTERTREIGVRKAVGARRSSILMQFLIESVVLCGLGGILGVACGAALGLSMRLLLSFPATLSPFWILTALTLCAGIGIGFGMYPAWKASKLDPVEALRYE